MRRLIVFALLAIGTSAMSQIKMDTAKKSKYPFSCVSSKKDTLYLLKNDQAAMQVFSVWKNKPDPDGHFTVIILTDNLPAHKE